MKVAITDYTFPDLSIEQEILQTIDCEVVAGQCKTPETLIELTSDADFVITQFAPIDGDVVRAMEKAQIIVRYGVGFDNVDCDAAKEKGIPVCNIPTYCTDEVADHTLAFILACTRQLRANCTKVVGGDWGLAVPITDMRALRDQTVGIIGLGRIGHSVGKRLQAFGCKVLVTDPVVSDDIIESIGGTRVSTDQLLADSDIVTLHCPSTPSTRNIIDKAALKQMKEGSILINVGRGDLVELAAVTEALASGHLSAAALDVFEQEPIPAEHAILPNQNLIVTSHIASCSPTASRTLRETAANLVVMASKGETLPHVVNGVGSEE